MKKNKITILVITVLFIASCSSLSNIATSNAAATNAGSACGKVLLNLYTQYKSTGKVDMTNSTTLLNVVDLATYYKTLKAHGNDAAYKTAFAAGLVTGSNGVITASNSLSVVNKLLSIGGLNTISTSTVGTATEAVSVAAALVNIFKSF